MMGVQVIELRAAARGAEVRRRRHDLRLPEVYAGARSSEDDLWNGYPEETNAPYGLAKKMLLVQAQAYRQQYGFNVDLPAAGQPVRAGRQLRPRSSHVIPALIRMLEAREPATPAMTVWGDGTPTREFLYVDDCAEGIVLAAERYDGASREPRQRPRDQRSAIWRSSIATLTGLRRRDRVGHEQAQRPAAPAARRKSRARAVRLRGPHLVQQGPRADRRVVSRSFTRQGIALAVLAAAEPRRERSVAAYGTDGMASTLGALVLAPVAVVSTAAFARRVAGQRFAIAAAAAYVVLPLLATRFMLVTYRSTFDHQALPDLVGLRATPWFALGVLLTAALAVAPRRAAGVSGAVAAVAALILWGTADLASIRNGLHETAWSITLLEWFIVAGFIGAARRNGWLAVALVGWLLAIILHAAHVGYDNAAFWQSLAAGATSRRCSSRTRAACPSAASSAGRLSRPVTPAELELEQREPLSEDHVLVRDA